MGTLSTTQQQPAAASLVLELYERESEYLYRLALRITGSHEDARDALQESFAKLLEKCENLSSVLRPEAWIRTILTRTAIDIRRKRHRKDETILESTMEGYSTDALERLKRARWSTPRPCRYCVAHWRNYRRWTVRSSCGAQSKTFRSTIWRSRLA